MEEEEGEEEGGELEKEIHLKARLLQILSSVNTKHKRFKYNTTDSCTQSAINMVWYGDLLRYRRGGAMLVTDSDSDRVGPWTKGYLCTTADGSGRVGNREGLLSCLTSAER